MLLSEKTSIDRATWLKLIGPSKGVKIVTALLIVITTVTAQPSEQKVTVHRDGWGVPHIYGDSDRAVAFGFGYAQAEDRLEALLENYLTATGRRAAAFGPSEVDTDFAQHLWGHAEAARHAAPSQPPDTVDLLGAFAAGVRQYLSDYPERAPAWAFAPSGEHAIALSRYLVWRDLIARADREFARQPDPGPLDTGHTLWALSPERTVDDGAVLCADPGGPWASPLRYYEAHLHGDRTHAWGHTVVGLPVLLFGHNRTLGWGIGSAGPDAADVYEIEMRSTAASTFLYDGRVRRLALDTLRIDVRTGDALTSVTRFAQRTEYGPILHRRKAYAYRIAADGTGAIDQLYRMMVASDFASFYETLKSAQIGSRSLLYADRRGRVHYLQTAPTPIRSETQDWHLPVDGNASDADWLGWHNQNDLIQIVDPDEGWIRDIGTSPDLLTAASPAVPDRYPPYIFNATPSRDPPRSRRLAQILSGYGGFTLQEVFDLVFDTYVADAHHWQRALADAWHTEGRSETADEAYALIQSWNGHADADERGLAIYLTWREACDSQGRTIDPSRVLTRSRQSPTTAAALIAALDQAQETHRKRYGRLDIPWREIHRFRRDDRSWGLSGVAHPHAQSLRHTSVSVEGVVGYGNRGQAAPTVVLFRPDRVESYTSAPFGQSDRANSPHRWDQAEALYAQNRFRRTRFDETEHLKTKKVLHFPQDPPRSPPDKD